MNKRHIEISVVKVENNEVIFRISKQTHFGEQFSQKNDPRMFCATNGINLISKNCTRWERSVNTLFCYGEYNIEDDTSRCFFSEFAKIMEAISEYNKTDGIGYKNIWPLKGEKYFYINSYLEIKNKIFSDDETDEKLKSVANLFRTEEEAKEHIEKIKNIFNRTENNI